MSLFDRIKNEALNQFIEVIEWLDDSGNTMLYRFPVHNQEIKNGAKLIVRESQAAVFVYKDKRLMFSVPEVIRLTAEIRRLCLSSKRGNSVLILRSKPKFISSTPNNLPMQNGEPQIL
jgi:SPFH domain-Band 7 family